MGDWTKTLCGLLVILGAIAALFGWLTDPSGTVTWWLRRLGPGTAALGFGLLLLLELRPDREPDYLRQYANKYFNRDGFCFAVFVTARDGVAYVEAYFQSQRDRPCVCQIALRPAGGEAGQAVDISDIECPPAGFGVARVPLPVPAARQGGEQRFEVGASVHYPEGRGKRLRFYEGQPLRTNATFSKPIETALMVASAAVGHHHTQDTSNMLTLVLPNNVADEAPVGCEPEVEILWRLGDPPLPERTPPPPQI